MNLSHFLTKLDNLKQGIQEITKQTQFQAIESLTLQPFTELETIASEIKTDIRTLGERLALDLKEQAVNNRIDFKNYHSPLVEFGEISKPHLPISVEVLASLFQVFDKITHLWSELGKGEGGQKINPDILAALEHTFDSIKPIFAEILIPLRFPLDVFRDTRKQIRDTFREAWGNFIEPEFVYSELFSNEIEAVCLV